MPLLSWLGSPTFPRSQDDQRDECDNDTAISAGEGWSGRSVNLVFQTVWGILRHGIMNHGRIFTKKKNVVTEVTYVFLIKPKWCVFSMH